MARIADKTYYHTVQEVEQAIAQARGLVDAAELPVEWQPSAFVKVLESLLASSVMIEQATTGHAASAILQALGHERG